MQSMHEEFGRYTLLRRLAVGGMAEIFLAALHGDAGFEKKVVVKRILPHLGADAGFVKMFIDEAKLAARMTHPNIVQVYDFGSVAGSYYIAMEYIHGIDVHHLLRSVQAKGRALSHAEVAALGEGISRGLAYTHSLQDDAGRPLGIVHRDVSPHNLMLSTAGDAKVMDFGIAKAAARLSRTATGTIKGKLAYMAPEQAAGKGASKQSDQFAVGVVLWECLTGQRLFVSDTEVSLMQAVLACHIPPLRSLRPDVPPALEAIVERALARDPAERYGDLLEMETDLTAFRFSLGGQGIVHLGELAKEFAAPNLAEAPDWSWAHGQGNPAGTRPIAARQPPPLPHGTGEVTPTAEDSVPSRNMTPPGGHLTPASRTGRRRTGSLRLNLRHRDRTPAPSPNAAPPRHRTTWRIDRAAPPATRSWWQRPSIFMAGLALVASLATPLFMWPSMVENGRMLTAAYQREMHTAHVMPLGTSDFLHGMGRLSLRTDGPAVDVYLGTARLGTTPLDEEVPAGRLQLRLVNEAVGIARAYEIFVPEGGSAQGLISSH